MAGDGIAVIEVAKLANVNRNFAPAVHRQTYLVGFDFGDRTKFGISDPFRSKRSANLKAITCGEGALCLVVNAHTGKPRRVIGELAAIPKANGNLVLFRVSIYYSRVVACLDFVDFAGGAIADNVFVGSVGIGEGALRSGHIFTLDIDRRLLIVITYYSLAL